MSLSVSLCPLLISLFTKLLIEQELGTSGKPGFYQGRVAQAIVDVVRQNGGVMTLDDLSCHDSEVVAPISTDYKVGTPDTLKKLHHQMDPIYIWWDSDVDGVY